MLRNAPGHGRSRKGGADVVAAFEHVGATLLRWHCDYSTIMLFVLLLLLFITMLIVISSMIIIIIISNTSSSNSSSSSSSSRSSATGKIHPFEFERAR